MVGLLLHEENSYIQKYKIFSDYKGEILPTQGTAMSLSTTVNNVIYHTGFYYDRVRDCFTARRKLYLLTLAIHGKCVTIIKLKNHIIYISNGGKIM